MENTPPPMLHQPGAYTVKEIVGLICGGGFSPEVIGGEIRYGGKMVVPLI